MGNARSNEPERERQHERPGSARTAQPRAIGPPRPSAELSRPDVLALQQRLGNRTATAAVQRASAIPVQTAGEKRKGVAAPTGARRLLGDRLNAQQLKSDLLKRLKKGPLFDEQELRDIEQQEANWLDAAGIGTYQAALEYTSKADYHDWLQLEPGQRLLIATLEFRGRVRDGEQNSPAYTLGRTLHANKLPAEERAPLDAERDQQIHESFVNTLNPREPSGATASDEEKNQARAQQLLTRIFLILQNGLQINTEQGHIDFRDGDVARALAHGGRVNIRIPSLSTGGAGRFELTQWLELTDEQGELTNSVTERDFATHYMSISNDTDKGQGAFKERGGPIASLRNKVPRDPDEQVRLMGVNGGMGGLRRSDCNGDVILPNGAHGHLLLIYTPPREKRAGSLEVGLETLAPHNEDSPVGYVHNWRSTEKTSNPESSVHGHKQDKIGSGKLRDNQRYVDLGAFPHPWAEFLRKVEEDWNALMNAAPHPQQERELVERLVGPRGEGRFPHAAGAGS